jgi:hypothetical protein
MIELIALGMVVSFQLAIVETGFQGGLSKNIERPINLDKNRWNEGNTQNSWCRAPVMN